MNWTNLECVDFMINHKTKKKHFQQYLKPSYYLEIYLRWTSNEEIISLHQSVIDEIGHLFTYHHNSSKSAASKIRDKEKTFNTISQFLTSKKNYLWHELSNNGGVGTDKEIGGASDALLSFWIHKTPYSEEKRAQQVDHYTKQLKEYNTDMLAFGLKLPKIQICFPIDHFKNTEDFFKWIMNNEFIKKGHFFSGSAGYRINVWQGYVNKNASEKLHRILSYFPGLDMQISAQVGRVLNDSRTDFLPIVKRLNWLTFISNEGVKELEGIENLKSKIEKNGISSLHSIENGICIRASETPSLSEKDSDFKQYYSIQNIIKKLRYRNYSRDNQEFSDWLYKFENKKPVN